MTFKGQYALCCIKDASFGAHCTKMNDDRPILSALKYRPMTLVCGNIKCTWIFVGVPPVGGVK